MATSTAAKNTNGRAIITTHPEAMVSVATATPSTGYALPGSANPVQDFFDGVVLLIRRTFFNQAPTVTPVEIGGKTEGPITGTVGAVDPEGDSIEYHLANAPAVGTIVLHEDGTYVYTPGADFDGADEFTVTATDTGLHINLLDLFRSPSTEAAVAVFQNPSGTPQVVFRFTFAGAEWTPAARDALREAGRDLASYLVVPSPRIITYLAGASTEPGALGDGNDGSFPGSLRMKILTGVDGSVASTDGYVNFDLGAPWAYGDTVGSGQYDFKTVATHELMHTLGFISNLYSVSYGSGSKSVFDGFIVTNDGSPITSANMIGQNGGLYFGGVNAVAAYGGLVPLYTPSVFNSGSSISHLDGSGDVMSHATAPGVAYGLSPVDLGILADLGYTVTLPTSSV